MSTTLSSCLKSYIRISSSGVTTATSAARNLFAEANFAQRTLRGTNITYNTTNNQIVFGNTGTRYFEVLFMGSLAASTVSQNGSVSIVVNGVTRKTVTVFSTGTLNVARQFTLYGVFSCTNGTTLQINYSGGTNVYIFSGSVIVRFIS